MDGNVARMGRGKGYTEFENLRERLLGGFRRKW